MQKSADTQNVQFYRRLHKKHPIYSLNVLFPVLKQMVKVNPTLIIRIQRSQSPLGFEVDKHVIFNSIAKAFYGGGLNFFGGSMCHAGFQK